MVAAVKDLTGDAGSNLFLFTDRETLAASDPLTIEWVSSTAELVWLVEGPGRGSFTGPRCNHLFVRLVDFDGAKKAKAPQNSPKCARRKYLKPDGISPAFGQDRPLLLMRIEGFRRACALFRSPGAVAPPAAGAV
jgi:hypothetical protein